MRTATLQRFTTSDAGTFGMLTTAEGLKLHTLELPWRDVDGDGDDDAGTSCVSAGNYRCTWTLSPRFKRYWYRLDDAAVAPRKGVLIHAGNWAGDRKKGLKCNVEGCLLMGLAVADLDGQRAVTHSRKACDMLEEHFQREPFDLVILPITPGQHP